MPADAFIMVLGAAMVHAIWNALIKADGDRLSLIKIMSLTQLVVSAAFLPFVAMPAADAWPYLMASVALNTGYMLSLHHAYQSGDLSLAYPLARGTAPFVVAVAATFVLGEQLSRVSQLAILMIGIGITSLALARNREGARDFRTVLLALITGVFIAGYTIADGLGARASGDVHGYMIWLSLITAISIVLAVSIIQKDKDNKQPVSPRSAVVGIASGIMSYGSSWIVIWALTLAPLAMVSALRETSIAFAVVIGALLLREPVDLRRWVSIATTMTGASMLKLSR